ncbi:MAG: Uma2 family endonuclease, partial [Chloroflexi bacterium]|nr:Uma2 family endonuclease [Chloroflexota bacterium]
MSIRPIQPLETLEEEIVYPESDGKPMADNTKQYRWIVTIEGGLEELFEDDPNVFVAGNLFWYPVKGDPHTNAAPDALVVLGRPKGDRRSYRQWVEENIPPQVVFEILSPSNDEDEMKRKLVFYETHGVEEYYLYDPDSFRLSGWIRTGLKLTQIVSMRGWVSPLLGIRFELDGFGGELGIYRPDGRRFTTYLGVVAQRRQQQHRAEEAEQQAEQERLWAEQERFRAEQAEQQVEQERQRAEQAEQQVEQERQQTAQERQRAEQAEQQIEQERQQTTQERQNMVNLLARLRAKG